MQSFEPFRVVGSICGTVPVSATTLYGTPVLMVAAGRTFQLYKGKELAMLRGGPTFLEPVSAVAQTGKYRIVAEGPRLHAFVHHKPLWSELHADVTRAAVTLLLVQDDLLFCAGEDKRVVVREVKTGRVLSEILVDKSETVTCLALLPGFANKLLVGTEHGALHLYNYRTGVCLWYAVKEPLQSILALACSQYKGIVAYGTSNGRVVVLNVATDEVVTIFEHREGVAVTSLVFRVDKDGFLVSGTSRGEVVVWDLEGRCMDGVLTRSKQVRSETDVLESPHMDAVHSLITFPQVQQNGVSTDNGTVALLVTAGADNALMQFRFDTVDGLGTLVRERRGHMGSCTVANFYNSDLLVTGGNDRALRVTHVFSDRASWELSQGKLGKKGREKQMGREALKMPPAIALASCTTRNYQWSSLVSLHTASAQCCGWRMDTRAQEFKLSGINTSAHTARAVAMSDCGNYIVVGYSSGNVAIVNVQNRSIKQLFDPELVTALAATTGSSSSTSHGSTDRAHESAVECVEVACGNTTVITAGLDRCIKYWDLQTGTLKAVVRTSVPATKSCVHQGSSLLILAQHFTIRVYHCNPDAGLTHAELSTPVRVLEGHTSPITALALAPDTHRYVASASGDGALLLWDLAAAACVGQYRFASPALSLAFHPDALFLATTHAGERGAFLWVNNLRYGFVPEVVPRPQDRTVEELPWLHFPTAHGESEAEVDSGAAASLKEQQVRMATEAAQQRSDGDDAEEEGKAEAKLFDASTDVALVQRRQEQERWAALDAIAQDGLQLSGVPRSMWFNLTVLDQIKEKNQPLLPPKKKDVPFFLPTTQELRPTFIVVASSGNGDGGAGARLVGADLAALTPVQSMLLARNHDGLMVHFLSMNTAQAIDLELKRVVEYVDGSEYTQAELDRMKDCLAGLLTFLAEWLRRGQNVDLVQGMLADTVRSHGPLLTRFGDALLPAMAEVAEAQNTVRYAVDHLVSYPSCLAGLYAGSVF